MQLLHVAHTARLLDFFHCMCSFFPSQKTTTTTKKQNKKPSHLVIATMGGDSKRHTQGVITQEQPQPMRDTGASVTSTVQEAVV